MSSLFVDFPHLLRRLLPPVLIAPLALALLGGEPARSATEDGVAAWRRGDYTGALHELRSAAAAGDRRAEYHLGILYAAGQGVPRDPVRAFELFACVSVRAADPELRGDAAARLQTVVREDGPRLAGIQACGLTAAGVMAGITPEETRPARFRPPLDYPPRQTLPGRLFWGGGEWLIDGVAWLGDQLGLGQPRALLGHLHAWFGEGFLGVTSLLTWAVAAKAGLVLLKGVGRLLTPRVSLAPKAPAVVTRSRWGRRDRGLARR